MYVSDKCEDLSPIERIALNNPSGVPHFPGFDLWLQRTALLAMVSKMEASYLIDCMSPDLRPELVFYAFLRLRDVRRERYRVIERLKDLAEAEQGYFDSASEYIKKMYGWPKDRLFH